MKYIININKEKIKFRKNADFYWTFVVFSAMLSLEASVEKPTHIIYGRAL